ncbi:membrane protein [Terrihabitans soli]|uniref:Membrane protein n=1 Tax=Terrihabitans soli TaxID=708113 RepID=A0A6S6QLH0_9HYPH|nr:DMT family transporter [Terrihabitans soli]BCJ90156.1 membrane protein [Terrihabitans soli]
MSFGVVLLVLISAATNAAWNFLIKSGEGDPLGRSAAVLIGAGVTAAPILLFTGLPHGQSLIFAASSAGIHATYMLLVGLSYRGADMSVAHPIIRGGSLIFTASLAPLLFAENLPLPAWVGVFIIAAGIIAMGLEAIARKGTTPGTLAVAVLAAGTISAYTLVDSTGVRMSGDPVAYVLTLSSLSGLAAFIVSLAVRPRSVLAMPRGTALRGLAGGFLFTLSYGIALYAITIAPVSLVAAVRETSILFGAALAVWLLNEKFTRWRWIAAFVILAGLVLTRLARG